jgi:hypothetical protein
MFNELTADVLAKKAVRDSPGFKVKKLFFSSSLRKNKLERFYPDKKKFRHSQCLLVRPGAIETGLGHAPFF